jgi:hypothetical protein
VSSGGFGVRHHYGDLDRAYGISNSHDFTAAVPPLHGSTGEGQGWQPVPGYVPQRQEHSPDHGMDPGQMRAMFAKQGQAIGSKGSTGVGSAKTPKAAHPKSPHAPHKEHKEHAEHVHVPIGQHVRNLKVAVKGVAKAAVTASGAEAPAKSLEEAASGHHFGLTHRYD